MAFSHLKDFPYLPSTDMLRQLKMKHSRLEEEARKKSKLSQCVLCGKQTTKFCNFHTIPQFVLCNITNNGYVHYWRDFLDIPVFLYTNRFLLSERINNDVKLSDEIRKLFHKVLYFYGLVSHVQEVENKAIGENKQYYSLKNYQSIPNYLSKEYCLRL